MQLEPIHPKLACATITIDHQMIMIKVQVGKNFIDDLLIDGGSKINIITENLIIQLGLSKSNLMPYNHIWWIKL